MRISNGTYIELVYFNDEEVSNQKVEFQGNAREFRIEHQENNNWDGFEKDEHFYHEEEKVLVFEKVESEDEKGNVDKNKYFIAPAEITPDRVKKDKLQ